MRVLFPAGSAIPAGTTRLDRTARPLHAASLADPLRADQLPKVENRPLRATKALHPIRFHSRRTT